jgi:hypothetical protein
LIEKRQADARERQNQREEAMNIQETLEWRWRPIGHYIPNIGQFLAKLLVRFRGRSK